MAEYIEREALENALNERVLALRRMYGNHDAFADGYDDCVGRVEEFPNTADVVEVVHGKWEDAGHGLVYKCSKCGHLEDIYLSKFCPECGARMDGE